jgi:uncharacterized protein
MVLAHRTIFALLCLSWLGLVTSASALVPAPRLTTRVTDQSSTLTQEQIRDLEQRLRQFEATKGSQVALLIVPTTEPEAIESFSLRVVEAWKIGRKGVDDGALLIVAKNDRALRIEVGYGLEGALPDAIAKRIIEEVIVPRFKQGDFAGGVSAGLEQIMKVIEGEPLPPPKASANPGLPGSSMEYLPFLIFGAFAIGGVLRAIFGRLLGATLGGLLAGVVVWMLMGLLLVGGFFGLFVFLLILLGNAGGGGRGGLSSGGFSHSSGGFGGGGGFSGGGGSFGGGGASGRW